MHVGVGFGDDRRTAAQNHRPGNAFRASPDTIDEAHRQVGALMLEVNAIVTGVDDTGGGARQCRIARRGVAGVDAG